MKRSFLFTVPKRKRQAMPHRATWRSTRVHQEKEEAREQHGPEPGGVSSGRTSVAGQAH